mmetsp:Transcript_20500/g.37305  ORF Transcript_20500/g.37305 Transcript_20500/m.37305 type:complete len:433 (+) Transcript_20500:71-1369(+)
MVPPPSANAGTAHGAAAGAACAEAAGGGAAPQPVLQSEAEDCAGGARALSDAAAVTQRVDEPEEIICPITQVMYRDPVFVPDSGNTYEREAIAKYWSASRQCRDPLTNSVLSSSALHTNWGTRREVQRFLDAHPEYVPQGWSTRQVPAPLQRAGNRSGLRWQLRSPMLAMVAVAVIGSFTVLDYKNVPRKQEGNSSKVSSAEIPSLPRGSRLAVTFSDDGSLGVRVPPSAHLAARLLERAVFASLWLGFTVVWTVLALRGERSMVFRACLLPFWGMGVMLILRIGNAVFAGERLYLQQGGRLTSQASPVLLLEREVFGWPYAFARLHTEDLQRSPQISCESTRACSLHFQLGMEEHAFGSVSSLTPDEAAWLQGALKKQLARGASAAGTEWRQFLGKLGGQMLQPYGGGDLFRRALAGFGLRFLTGDLVAEL